ncbi:MAG TPA: fibronectin type III domain-containing protein [Gemmatimonadales bacterium]
MRFSVRPFRWSALALAGFLAACGDDGDGGTEPPPPALQAPAGVQTQATSATTARITWTAAANATSYLVQRAPTGGAFQTVGNPAGTSFDDTGLAPQTAYRYQVASVSGSTTSGFSTETTITTPAAAKPTIEVTSDITSDVLWLAENVYVLKGFIHVANGARLIIQPGTRIVGDFNTVGSSLFVLRGARIIAEGTADRPIVFTSSREPGQRQAGDWGGLIIVGNGIINRGVPVILEGSGTGPTNPAIDYAGGVDNGSSSGVLKYVRIEFAGYATAPDAELNSLTMAAVGSGTQVEYVQSLNGLDDSFEWFGGAVDAKYLVSYNSGDDHFDASEGYVGRVQHAIAYQTRTVVPRPAAGNVSQDPQGLENDGCAGANCTNGQNSVPLTVPMFANLTVVGPPSTVTNSSGNIGMMLRRGTGGFYLNSVVSRWSRAGMSLRDQPTLDRIASGDLVLRNLLFTEVPVVCQPQTGSTVQGCVDLPANAITSELATTATSLFLGLPAGEPANAAALDWTPTTTSPAGSGGLNAFTGSIATKAGSVVTPTSYRGAAGTTTAKWWAGWTNFAVN